MLHELLLSLSGFPGSIFVNGENGTIKVVPDIPFLHRSEVSILNRLCILGTHYRRFREFIKEYSGSPSSSLDPSRDAPKDHLKLRDGLYLRAFCAGLDKVLDPYRKELLRLEQEILLDPHLTPCHIQEVLEPYQLLFPDLWAVIEQIRYQRGHGGHILEIVHQHCNCGKPMVKDAFQKILFVCHCVLYRQVTAWLLHGMLLDRHSEFFIHKSAVSSLVERQYDDDDLGIGGVTGRQMREVMQLNEDGRLPERPAHTLYAIRPAMLPSYIPVRVAEKILFVGESVQMFENRKQTVASKYTDSVLGDKEDIFASRFHQLRQEPLFSIKNFEDAIDGIRSCVAEHLWRLVVEESDLVGQLHTLKDFFLLGRGELFLAFIDHAQNLLKTPPTSTTEHDVNLAFRQAAHKVLLEDDTSLGQVRLTATSKTPIKGASKKSEAAPQSKSSGDIGWNCLGMTYNVQWPLHTLFNAAALEKYNTLFRFLLSIKRVQLELQQCWALQMQRKHAPAEQSDASKWRLRSHMAFLVDNLQYYLQVDVLETQFTQLIDKISSTRDFEAVRLAHDQFLTSLLGQCFLLMKPVSHCLNEIMELCHSFAVLLITHAASMTDREVTHMDKLSQGFSRQSSLLFKILSSVRSHHQASPHLSQLLLRLDFNKYYSQAEGALAP
ncbi:gamma-tubulin complex component 4-like [Acanthaster planci]|uniref:Gamma-tubulin complex component n=1 Tax=Acanthaster planci TaxID=133434 RepID=A0A8B7ZLZ6_ACAPL|nr:gamma-tubulin complex component 4-like [Acanthaster planci]